MRTHGRVRLLALVSVVCSLALAACSSSGQPAGSGARVKGGTATIALTQTDSVFN